MHVFPLFPTAADPSLLFPARGFAERGLTPVFSVHNYQIINYFGEEGGEGGGYNSSDIDSLLLFFFLKNSWGRLLTEDW